MIERPDFTRAAIDPCPECRRAVESVHVESVLVPTGPCDPDMQPPAQSRGVWVEPCGHAVRATVHDRHIVLEGR